jgi:hypothetical protein
LRVRAQNVQPGPSSEHRIREGCIDVDVPDERFDPEHLPQAADARLEQAYDSRVIEK